jgi:hypothetical protein
MTQVKPLPLRSIPGPPAMMTPASTRLWTVTRSHPGALPAENGQPPSGGPAAAAVGSVVPRIPAAPSNKAIRFAFEP